MGPRQVDLSEFRPKSLKHRKNPFFYGPKPTKFMIEAKSNGAIKVVDGLEMLVEQAAESFFLWTGLIPETKAVLNNLRNKITSKNEKK